MKITLESVERETEKAILAMVELECAANRRGIKVWFPKSQVTIDDDVIDCPDWLAAKKLDEVTGGRSGYWFN